MKSVLPGDRHPGAATRTAAPQAAADGAARAAALPEADGRGTVESGTRAEVVQLLLEEGPVSASQIGTRLGLSAAGVRRHIDALVEQGEAEEASGAGVRRRGPGRPAKLFRLTAQGRARLGHAYDDLAGAAVRELREIGGPEAVAAFARRRVREIVEGIADGHAGTTDQDAPGGEIADEDARLEQVAGDIADAMSSAGYAANTRRVGNGVQICQHHCPVSHVAAEFPEFCEAEQEAFRDLLGTHIQQLATIANGDAVCTTHVPLGLPHRPAEQSDAQATSADPPAPPG